MSFYPVILAGGSGKRLWPLSRRREPKFLMPVAGADGNLLRETLQRLQRLASIEDTYLVTGETYVDRIREAAPEVLPERVLVEPFARDSGPAVALAAAVIAHRHPGSVMGSFAADHHISDAEAFCDAVRLAIRGAERDLLMTVGVEPTRPDTGYGYIHYDAASEAEGIYSVGRFKEKPSLPVATEFLRAGDYLWNASMFVWRPEVFLEELRSEDPDMHGTVTALAAVWDTPDRAREAAAVWPRLKSIAVEYLVMEPASLRGRIATVRGCFDWTDVGDFNTLGEINQPDSHGNAILPSDGGAGQPPVEGALNVSADRAVLIKDGENLVLHPGSGKLLAVVGADNLAIIDTDDVLLVCARSRVGDVKEIVDALSDSPRSDVL